MINRVSLRGVLTSGGLDPDVQTFLTATSISDATTIDALDLLVKDLKSLHVWTDVLAVYPFVGGSATTHKFNLKNPVDTDGAYRLTMHGGLTHSSTGVLGNGTTGYMDTKLVPSSVLTVNDETHISYIGNNVDGTYAAYGSQNGSFRGDALLPRLSNGAYIDVGDGTGGAEVNTNSSGLWVISIGATSPAKVYRNGSLFANKNWTTQVHHNESILLLARRAGGATGSYAPYSLRFHMIIDRALTTGEMSSISTIINTFQTSLSRNAY